MTSQGASGSAEQEAMELLPWYVNGSLAGEERELVCRQVLTSLACRKELERLRHLQLLIHRDDPDTAATDREFERLMVRIRASDAALQHVATRRGTAGWPFALAASLTAAVSVLLWWATSTMAPPRTYETMSETRAGDPAAMGVRVLFAAGVTESERRNLLERHGLTVVEAVAGDGLVTLAFPDRANRTAIMAALRQDPRIRLVTSPPDYPKP
jgi:hypothetical protein